ncbi:MAG: nicotinamide mononucleotide transporter [Clostridia bacterium]|nr:nicotinamide mononucleotide transporter [Clostridia bacterium]
MNGNLQESKHRPSAKNIFIIVLMVCTAVAITVTAIHNKQDFLQILPLYVSLIIALLQSRVNRYSSLLGSMNSLLYGVVYFIFNIYGSALSAVFFSCPIQLLTFIRWNKNKRGESTLLHRMSWKQRILLLLGYVFSVAAMWIILPLLGSEYVFLDSITTLLGIFIYFLTMFAFVEYTVLMLVNGVLGIALYLTMLPESPEIATHLIFSVYSLICIIFAFFEANKLYKSQQGE